MTFNLGNEKGKFSTEDLEENERIAENSIREIELKIQGLQTEEVNLFRKRSKQVQKEAVWMMGKDIERTRDEIKELQNQKSRLERLYVNIQKLKSMRAKAAARRH